MGMLESIQQGKFTIVCEFTPHSADDVRHVAEVAKGLPALNEKYAAQGIEFAGISLTQNPGGNLSYDHLGAIGILRREGFPESLEICPHVTGKDMNIDGVRSLLLALAGAGVGHVLALTGDLSALAQGVFELDSLGVLELVREVNVELLQSAGSPEAFALAPQIVAGAAVSPFKYTPGSLAMQYIKAHKKVREGAAFLTCQSGWDANRSEHMIGELAYLDVPLIGNALVVNHAAAQYMQTLPGCVVTEHLLRRLKDEDLPQALERAGHQIAMFRQLGYAGVDLGRPGDFRSIEEIEQVVEAALAVGDWHDVKDNITFPAPEAEAPPVAQGAGFSKFFHRTAMEEDGLLYPVAKAVLTPFEKSAEREGALYRLFNCIEGAAKGVMYQCEHCGDCFLPENHYVCTMGQCEKGLNNPPCGDADARGYCGNNENRVCVGETLYYRVLHYGDLEAFKERTLPRRKPDLEDSASVLNYYFKRDHASTANPLESSGLIQVGELVHASIPKPGAAMKHIQKMGEEGFRKPNPGRLFIENLIKEQSEQGADYLDINVDALADPDATNVMREYVRLVHRHGNGTPPCIDSSDISVLVAGLEEWFSLAPDTPPLLNSITYVERDKYGPILDLRGRHEFSAVCLLVGPEGPLKSADEMVEAARELFRMTTAAGFRADQIFFDCVTLGIASDGCMDSMGNIKPSHTHNSFHAIQRIRQDPEMKGVHAILGVSNWVYGATKRRIGHVRAFIAVGQKYGLDAGIVDVSKGFGVARPAAPELMDFVQSYVDLDGGEDSMMDYMNATQKAREKNWI